MMSKYRPSWLTQGLLATGLAVGFAACGDDSPVNPDPDPDADVCDVHGGCDDTLTLPEGGEYRFELFQTGYDAATGEHQEVLGGWFYAFTGQNPEARAYLGPPVDGIPNCFDQTAGNYFLNGHTEQNEGIIQSRSYYDVGEYITARGPNEIRLNRQTNQPDPSQLLQHPVIYLAEENEAANLERGAAYTLAPIAPVGDFEGFEPINGVNPILEAAWEGTPAMFMPPNFRLTTPTEEEYFAEGGLKVDPAQDLAFHWEVEGEYPEEWPGAVQFVGFLGSDQKFHYLCLGPTSPLTVSKELFEVEGFPTEGKLIHGSLTHLIFNQRGHRFDMIGANCKFSSFKLEGEGEGE